MQSTDREKIFAITMYDKDPEYKKKSDNLLNCLSLGYISRN